MRSIINLLGFFSNNNPRLWELSITRYSQDFYMILNSKILDYLLWMMIYPFFGFFIVPYTKFRVQSLMKSKIKMIVNVSEEEMYNKYFSDILENIDKKEYVLEGHNFDIPNIKNVFSVSQTINLILFCIFSWPVILIISIILKKNLFRAVLKSITVFYKSLNHFIMYPSYIYFTYQDNMCSAALKLGFENAGGKKIIALCNGVRMPHEGIKGSYFDHLYCLGDYYSNMYRSFGVVVKHDAVGSLALSKFKDSGKHDIEYDILFIDQGFPYSDLIKKHTEKFHGFSLSDKKRYVNDIKKLKKEFPHYKIAYQLRKYEDSFAKIITDSKKYFENSNINVLVNKDNFVSYRNLEKSRIIVTIDSTIGIEALSLNKMCIFACYSLNKESLLLSENKLQFMCRSYDDLKKQIMMAIRGDLDDEMNNIGKYIPRIHDVSPNEVIRNSIKNYLSKINY